MSGQADILGFLRVGFDRVDARLDGVARQLREHTERSGRLETAMLGVRRDVVDIFGHLVSIKHRLDAMDTRLDRVERRLALVGTS